MLHDGVSAFLIAMDIALTVVQLGYFGIVMVGHVLNLVFLRSPVSIGDRLCHIATNATMVRTSHTRRRF
jgi:hypothetical protein